MTVTVVATTPLAGADVPANQIPAPVQAATALDIAKSGANDLSSFLNRRFAGVHINDTQNNPFQPDVNYRGYTASPLLGTPQGLSVYVDGVRFNQPFGDVVNWDLIPRMALASATLMPGSNPVFGLNTLGGALAIGTKSGLTSGGTIVDATFGSNLRRAFEFEHGGYRSGSGLAWYVAGNVFAEDGWRAASPSDVRQVFAKVGRTRANDDISVTGAYANNSLNGNGLQEQTFLDEDFASVYTKPDTTNNRSTLLNVVGRRAVNQRVNFTGNTYFRLIRTATLNGDINEDSLDQPVYQPGAAERAALAQAGYTNVPASGADATNTPFPFLRCIGNILLQDEPGEQCNGLINRTNSAQRSAGGAGQLNFAATSNGIRHQITVGGAYDRSHADFSQTTELGYLNVDRSVTGTGTFADGVSAGDVDGEPYDARVELEGAIQTSSFYAADLIHIRDAWHITLSGRFDRTSIDNEDRILEADEPGTLTASHVFSRFNPAVGVTFNPSPAVNVYAGYSEGSRAATSIELGCADPERPCKLPNAMAGDPPLDQVVTRTVEAGLRGSRGRAKWNVGVFHAVNNADILFVMSEQSGLGYFRNFGQTRRQGFELGATRSFGKTTIGAGYTYLDATFQSEESVNGESNSSNDADAPGLEGSIEIEPGDRMPLIPQHMLKVFADVEVTTKLAVDLNLIASGGVFARGNENNEHEPDGVVYLGEGSTSGYGVVNLGARYALTSRVQLRAQVDNLFDQRYYTGAQLGPTGFAEDKTFVARPLPAVNGGFPVRQATFYAPGAPRRAWLGVRLALP